MIPTLHSQQQSGCWTRLIILLITTQHTASSNGPQPPSHPRLSFTLLQPRSCHFPPPASPPAAAGPGPGVWGCAEPPGCGPRPPPASLRPICSAPSTTSQTSRTAVPNWRRAPRFASPGNRPWMPAQPTVQSQRRWRHFHSFSPVFWNQNVATAAAAAATAAWAAAAVLDHRRCVQEHHDSERGFSKPRPLACAAFMAVGNTIDQRCNCGSTFLKYSFSEKQLCPIAKHHFMRAWLDLSEN